jgi:hypothetical protein
MRCVVDDTDPIRAEYRASHGSFIAVQMKALALAIAVLIAGCGATQARSDREKAEVSASERIEYEDQAQQTHDRAALMMTLIASPPR